MVQRITRAVRHERRDGHQGERTGGALASTVMALSLNPAEAVMLSLINWTVYMYLTTTKPSLARRVYKPTDENKEIQYLTRAVKIQIEETIHSHSHITLA